MNYPVWDVPHLGSGLVIALIAIFHVMIAHFAVGGGLFLPLAEAMALENNRRDWLAFLPRHSKFFLILTGVFGAVSGVGIWFSIGLASPEGTSTLIHNFVFGWAIEWVFFLIELTTAAVYYYTWGRIPDQLHLKVGWLYAASSFATLVIINGILTFMLTPGQAWLSVAGTGREPGLFVWAFFNPTYWPSLALRTLSCIALAGIWALVTGSRIDGATEPQLKARLDPLVHLVVDSRVRVDAHLLVVVHPVRSGATVAVVAVGDLDHRRRNVHAGDQDAARFGDGFGDHPGGGVPGCVPAAGAISIGLCDRRCAVGCRRHRVRRDVPGTAAQAVRRRRLYVFQWHSERGDQPGW